MNSHAVLITRPAVDFSTLLSISSDALGYSVADACDASRRELSSAERLLSMLSAMKDRRAAAGLTPSLLNQVSFSVLIAASEFDMLEVLECAAGMPFVTTETIVRGIQLTVVHGTLAQWRDAVVTGTRRAGEVQRLYCRILSQFESENLNVWMDYTKRWPTGGDVFFLEDKRKK